MLVQRTGRATRAFRAGLVRRVPAPEELAKRKLLVLTDRDRELLNAVQYGLILYLVASGLTLLLGIMGVINLAHGAFYMVGAYVAYFIVSKVAGFSSRKANTACAPTT